MFSTHYLSSCAMVAALFVMGCGTSEQIRRPLPSDTSTNGVQFADSDGGEGSDVDAISDLDISQADSHVHSGDGISESEVHSHDTHLSDLGMEWDSTQNTDSQSLGDVQPTGDAQVPNEPISGGVLIIEVDAPNYKQATVGAQFVYGTLPEPQPVAVHGDCNVLPPAPAEEDPGWGLDSGTISVTGLPMLITLNPEDQGVAGYVYKSSLPATASTVLSNSADVTVKASGGAHLPPWTLTTTVPTPLTLIEPTTDVNVFNSVDDDKPLAVKWNAGNGTAINIYAFVTDTGGNPKSGNTVNCTLSSDTGSFLIPSKALKALPSGGGLLDTSILVVTVSRIVTVEKVLTGAEGKVTVGVVRTKAGLESF